MLNKSPIFTEVVRILIMSEFISFELMIRISLIFYALAALFYFLSTLTNKHVVLNPIGKVCSAVAFIIQTFGIIFRMSEYYTQYNSLVIPATGFFEALNFFAWSIGLVFVIGTFFVGMNRIGWLVMVFPTIFLAILQFGVNPSSMLDLAPSLRNSVWLNLHILTIFLSYGSLIIGAVLAIMYLVYSCNQANAAKEPLKKFLKELDQTSYMYIAVAFPFLTAGIWLGAVWADQAWGRPWGWDPKEVWSLITWLVYAAYLHARLIAKWDSRKTNWFAVLGLVALLITFFGVNLIVKIFQLKSMHAYN